VFFGGIMNLIVKGLGLSVTPAMQNYVTAKLLPSLTYFDGVVSATVTFSAAADGFGRGKPMYYPSRKGVRRHGKVLSGPSIVGKRECPTFSVRVRIQVKNHILPCATSSWDMYKAIDDVAKIVSSVLEEHKRLIRIRYRCTTPAKRLFSGDVKPTNRRRGHTATEFNVLRRSIEEAMLTA
jgi:ribosomal subunit interface protein